MEKLIGLAVSLGIVLAVIAGIIPIPGLDVALVLVVLGIIGGITASQDGAIRMYLAVLVLPIIASALGAVPMIGEQLGAIFNNAAVLAAGFSASLVARRLYEMAMAGITSLTAK